MKIALIHGFLKEYGGAERVLEALHEIYPQAPIYTAFVDFKGLGPHSERIKKWDVRESKLGRTWFIKKLHSPLRFLAPLIWESFNLDEFDVVISSSGWYICRGIITRPETLHVCYLHHPPRHLYGYKTSFEWQKHLPIRVYGHLVNHYLRMYDFLAAQRVDHFIANSQETALRIKKFYRRESTVIYPPVKIPKVSIGKHLRGVRKASQSQSEVTPRAAGTVLRQSVATRRRVAFGNARPMVATRSLWRSGDSSDGGTERSKAYFLCVSRLARAKNIDLAIKTCNQLKLPLKIVGKGREEEHLKSMAGPTIEFLGEVPDEKLDKIYTGAKALIFPAQDEEFGIVPIEAMVYGVPVIAFRSGGVVETVVKGKTGLFFDELTTDSLIAAIKQFNNLTINPEHCVKQAKKFSKERFEREIKNFVNQKLKELALT